MKKVIRILSVIFVSLLLPAVCFADATTGFTWTERYVNNTLYAGTGSASGTATGGGNTTICLAADASVNDDDYNNYGITLLGGTGTDGENRRITDYDATGGACEKLATVNAAWTANPDATTTYEIIVGSNANNGVSTGLYGGTNGAWGTFEYATTTLTTGQRGNILAGREYDLVAVPTAANSGTLDAPIILEGYTSTAGDGGIAIIDAQSTQTNCWSTSTADLWILRNFEMKGATDDGVTQTGTGATDGIMIHIKMDNAGDYCFYNAGYRMVVFDCDIAACVDGAVHDDVNLFYSYIHDTTNEGIERINAAFFNIFDTTGGLGLGTSDYGIYLNNTFYNSTGDNIFVNANMEYAIAINNICHTATDYNIDGSTTTGNFLIQGYNNMYLGTTGTIHANTISFHDLGGDQTGDPDFVNTTTDFNLDASTTIDDDGYPASWIGLSNTTGNMEMGACPYEETGGGTAVGSLSVSTNF